MLLSEENQSYLDTYSNAAEDLEWLQMVGFGLPMSFPSVDPPQSQAPQSQIRSEAAQRFVDSHRKQSRGLDATKDPTKDVVMEESPAILRQDSLDAATQPESGEGSLCTTDSTSVEPRAHDAASQEAVSTLQPVPVPDAPAPRRRRVTRQELQQRLQTLRGHRRPTSTIPLHLRLSQEEPKSCHGPQHDSEGDQPSAQPQQVWSRGENLPPNPLLSVIESTTPFSGSKQQPLTFVLYFEPLTSPPNIPMSLDRSLSPSPPLSPLTPLTMSRSPSLCPSPPMLLSPLLCSSPCVTAKELLVDEDHSSCPMGSVAGTHGPAEPAPDDDSDEAGDCSRPIAIDSDAYMSHQEPNEPQHVFCMYRRGERAQLTVLWQDVDRLQPGLWLNDTLVELGLRMWYDFELDPALRAQTYLASSFLFESLHSGADPLLRYSRTCNALGPVNIFLYRFLVIPVHDCDHFYMIIVSNPAHCLVSINPGQGAVRSCTTVYPVAPSFVEGMLHPWTRRVEWEDGRTSLSDCPAIWILDSKLPKAIAQKFQRKVTRQTKVIPQGAVHSRLNGGLLDPSVLLNDFISSQAQSLGLSIVWPCSAWELNVPQQDNDCDCGLLAIHYARRFMSDPLTIMRSPSGQEIFDWREQDLPILRAELRDKVRGLRASGV